MLEKPAAIAVMNFFRSMSITYGSAIPSHPVYNTATEYIVFLRW